MESTQNSFSYPVHPSATVVQNNWMLSTTGSFGGLTSPGYLGFTSPASPAFPIDIPAHLQPPQSFAHYWTASDSFHFQPQQQQHASLSSGSFGRSPTTPASTTTAPSSSTPAKRTNNPYAAMVAVGGTNTNNNSPVMGRVGSFPSPVSAKFTQSSNVQQRGWSAASSVAAAPFTPSSHPPSPPPQPLPRPSGKSAGAPSHLNNSSGINLNNIQAPFGNNGVVALSEVLTHAGHFEELARTANGSSFIQAAVREGNDEANLAAIWQEIEPCFCDLLLDAHGCYVVKSIMERLPAAEMHRVLDTIARDSLLVFSMCTHSLHTRRVVQYLLDHVDCTFIINLLAEHCFEIATTQQGCIIMQRAMDVAKGPSRIALFTAIYRHLFSFAVDPFANYVAQHLLEVGEKESNSEAFLTAFDGHVVELSCNKFASNVMETALFHLNSEAQHLLLVEMYSGGEETLYKMLQDSFGNYIIQSSIALAQQKDILFMNDKLRPVLQRTPYGHKIEARIDRRMKGKPVGVRNAMFGPAGQRPTLGARPTGDFPVQGGQHSFGGSGSSHPYHNNTNGGGQHSARRGGGPAHGALHPHPQPWNAAANTSVTTISSIEDAAGEEPW